MNPSSTSSNYARVLQRLSSWERYEPVPHARNPNKLRGVRKLLEQLNHPESQLRIVHVAGTNGKGMCAAMIDGILRNAGSRVGRYTSPHLTDIRERFLIDAQPVDSDLFGEIGHRVLDLAEPLRQHIRIAYFDVLTVMGLAMFNAQSVDWLVLETGLGGMADATNVAPKELAVITRIGWDHMSVLGSSLEAIAEQKLGIARKNVPAVMGRQPPELDRWMELRLAELSGPVHRSSAFRCAYEQATQDSVTIDGPGGATVAISVPMIACTPPRMENAATALTAAHVLLGPADAGALRARGLAAVGAPLAGRLDLRRNAVFHLPERTVFETLVLDGAHNGDAIAALNDQLTLWGIDGYSLIFAMLKDKFVPQSQSSLGKLFDRAANILTLPLRGPRSVDAEATARLIRQMSPQPGGAVQVTACTGAREALVIAGKTRLRPVVVAGSFWMLGDVLKLLEGTPGEAARNQ